ncbi:uncharacterized protein LOC130672737 [Microplitis mediator]|uniref:uncharacterized protein LOC130672737 n=1 Tax=Microplitis mediator TaxID=375433 RepID=UPI0025553DF4|nr:uncharacterized protein LOC130672737 [Microplitis mediator]
MDKQREPMTEEELLELSEKLDEQCKKHDDREADLEARERLLNDRLSDLSERDQTNIEKESKLRDLEAELRRLEISLGERELELKSRDLINRGEPNELKAEFERRLQELKERESESSQLLEQAQIMQTERLNKREVTLANREHKLTEIQENLDLRERDLLERENAVAAQEKELRNDSKFLQTWASELTKMKASTVTKMPSVIQELKDEMSQLRSSGSNELTCNANITIKDALSYVPTFDGTSAAVSDFIRSCNRACSMLAPSAEFMFLTLVRQKFKGDARITVENME